MKTLRPVIAVDVDEVCANLLEGWLSVYNHRYGDDLRVEEIKGWGLMNFITKCSEAQFYAIVSEPGFYNDHVVPLPMALEGIKELRRLGRVLFVTSCSRGTMDQKRAWLEEWGFLDRSKYIQKDLVMASDKSIINADFLIDDAIHNVAAFDNAPQRLGILMNHTHNEAEDWHRRVDNLVHAAEFISKTWNQT